MKFKFLCKYKEREDVRKERERDWCEKNLNTSRKRYGLCTCFGTKLNFAEPTRNNKHRDKQNLTFSLLQTL